MSVNEMEAKEMRVRLKESYHIINGVYEKGTEFEARRSDSYEDDGGFKIFVGGEWVVMSPDTFDELFFVIEDGVERIEREEARGMRALRLAQINKEEDAKIARMDREVALRRASKLGELRHKLLIEERNMHEHSRRGYYKNASECKTRVKNLEDEIERLKKEEENAMGAELYGYPEDDVVKPERDVEAEIEARNKIAAMVEDKKKYEARIAKLEEENAMSREEYNKLHQQKVEEDYGIVTERYLWKADIDYPFNPFLRFWNSKERENLVIEFLTSTKSATEASYVAEGIAKSIRHDAEVKEVRYVREIRTLVSKEDE